MKKTIRFFVKSALCTAWFRLHGYQTSLVGCEGQLPVLGRNGANIRIGKRFVLRSRIARCEIGAFASGKLLIGDRVFINQGVVISAQESIEIGDDTKIGDFSAIYDSNYHEIDPAHPAKARPVTIGKNVWLGSGVLVLAGSSIGDHTVVAARSVVNSTLPPRVLAAGNPARVVKQLDVPDGWRRALRCRAFDASAGTGRRSGG